MGENKQNGQINGQKWTKWTKRANMNVKGQKWLNKDKNLSKQTITEENGGKQTKMDAD